MPGTAMPRQPAYQAQPSQPTHRVVSTQPGSQDVEQEVTQFCPIPPCTWASFRTSNPDMLSVCFNQLLVHLRHVHEDTDLNPGMSGDHRQKGSKTHKEYKAATKPRTILKTMDDASHNLCEARFFPFPLNLKSCGLNMPTSITPVNTIVDMSHLGVDVNNPELLRKMHDRAVTNIRLRDFSDTNLRNYHAAGDALVAVETSRSQLQLGRCLKQLEGTKVGWAQ